MLPKSTIIPSQPKPLINIGACLDIPVGVWVRSADGDWIILGGLGHIVGMTGIGNSWKTTIMRYMELSAASRISWKHETHIDSLDTETNIVRERQLDLAQRHPTFRGRDILKSDTNPDAPWTITDSTVYYGNVWHDEWKKYCDLKVDNAKTIMVKTPFMNNEKQPLYIMMPTFADVDSFSRFETEDVAKKQEENQLGSAELNMINMRQGLSKSMFLNTAPTICGRANCYLLLTAHLGSDTTIAAGPYAPQPKKKLAALKTGEKIKGVTEPFFFLTTAFFCTTAVTKLVHKDSGAPQFPKNKFDVAAAGEADLNLVDMTVLRSKYGPSGVQVPIVVSQMDGVLPEMTEFMWIKENGRFGMEGNDQNYFLTLLPEIKLSRTVIRSKIEENPKLARALNITSEVCQMRQFHRHLDPTNLDMKKIYEGVISNGYDWNFILEQTRGWWTIDDDEHPLYRLSTLSLVEMSIGIYHPYWMEDDKKTIKKKYQRKPSAI